MIHTTFKKAKEAGACIPSYRKMATAVGGVDKYGADTPLPLDKVLEVCGLSDTLWTMTHCTIETPESFQSLLVLWACDCAERSLVNFEKVYPDDKRPRNAIEAAREYAKNPTKKNRSAAGSAAGSAAWSAESAARSTAGSAARSTAGSDAGSTAGSDAWSAAWSAEREWQKQKLLELLREVK